MHLQKHQFTWHHIHAFPLPPLSNSGLGTLGGCCLNRARTVRAPCTHRASFCVFCVHQIHNA